MFRTADDIKTTREALRLSQEEYAERYGVSLRQVQRWEKDGVSDAATKATRRTIVAAEGDNQLNQSPVVKVVLQADVMRRQIAAAVEDLDMLDLRAVFFEVKRLQARALARRFSDEVADELGVELPQEVTEPVEDPTPQTPEGKRMSDYMHEEEEKARRNIEQPPGPAPKTGGSNAG